MNGATELQIFYDILAALGFIVIGGIILGSIAKAFKAFINL
jgi:hypothetical protein